MLFWRGLGAISWPVGGLAWQVGSEAKLAEECLVALGFDDDHAREVLEPLQTLHHLRSKLKGHSATQDAVTLKKAAIAEHKTYREHFRALCERCDKSMHIISEAFKNLN